MEGSKDLQGVKGRQVDIQAGRHEQNHGAVKRMEHREKKEWGGTEGETGWEAL